MDGEKSLRTRVKDNVSDLRAAEWLVTMALCLYAGANQRTGEEGFELPRS